jgi:hypothetical protein
MACALPCQAYYLQTPTRVDMIIEKMMQRIFKLRKDLLCKEGVVEYVKEKVKKRWDGCAGFNAMWGFMGHGVCI